MGASGAHRDPWFDVFDFTQVRLVRPADYRTDFPAEEDAVDAFITACMRGEFEKAAGMIPPALLESVFGSKDGFLGYAKVFRDVGPPNVLECAATDSGSYVVVNRKLHTMRYRCEVSIGVSKMKAGDTTPYFCLFMMTYSTEGTRMTIPMDDDVVFVTTQSGRYRITAFIDLNPGEASLLVLPVHPEINTQKNLGDVQLRFVYDEQKHRQPPFRTSPRRLVQGHVVGTTLPAAIETCWVLVDPGAAVSIEVTREMGFRSRRLVPRGWLPGPPPPVPPLTEEERRQGLTAVVEKYCPWVEENNLHRRPDETEYAFARRVMVAVNAIPHGDCGCRTNHFCTAMALSGIPVRTLIGHIAHDSFETSRREHASAHVWSEYYSPKHGWVLVEATRTAAAAVGAETWHVAKQIDVFEVPSDALLTVPEWISECGRPRAVAFMRLIQARQYDAALPYLNNPSMDWLTAALNPAGEWSIDVDGVVCHPYRHYLACFFPVRGSDGSAMNAVLLVSCTTANEVGCVCAYSTHWPPRDVDAYMQGVAAPHEMWTFVMQVDYVLTGDMNRHGPDAVQTVRIADC